MEDDTVVLEKRVEIALENDSVQYGIYYISSRRIHLHEAYDIYLFLCVNATFLLVLICFYVFMMTLVQIVPKKDQLDLLLTKLNL